MKSFLNKIKKFTFVNEAEATAETPTSEVKPGGTFFYKIEYPEGTDVSKLLAPGLFMKDDKRIPWVDIQNAAVYFMDDKSDLYALYNINTKKTDLSYHP